MRFSHRPVNRRYAVSSSDSNAPTPLYREVMDLEWLKTELQKPGRSQSALARFMRLSSPSIVNRIVSGDRQIKAHEAEMIRAYLAATQRSGDNASAGGGAALAPLTRELTPPVGVRFIKLHGKVEAGAWREVFPDAPQESYPVPDLQMFAGDDLFVLGVAGPSMNEHYKDGSFVVCRHWRGLPIDLVGKHVVVERTDAGGKVETTLKELVMNDRMEFELWPRSTDPRYQEPIHLDPADDREVRVIGRVIYKFEPVE